MSIYTITPSLIKKIGNDEQIYFTEILFALTHRGNAYKVAKDKNGEVITIYKSIKENADCVKTWLEFMSFTPSKFEKVDVDVSSIDCEETKFIKICKETKGVNNLIVYSSQDISKHEFQDKMLFFEGVTIRIFDRDDASLELKVTKGDTIINSVVAKEHSQISNAKNKP